MSAAVINKRLGLEVVTARGPWARLLTGACEPAMQTLWPVSLNPWVYSIQSCARGRAGCECTEFQLVGELLWARPQGQAAPAAEPQTPATLMGL